MIPLRIFVGWDPREAEAYHVFCHSLIRRSSRPIAIIPIAQDHLRTQGVYTRPRKEGATEFSMSRWLVPYLCNYRGYALFADSDMLALGDIAELFEFVENSDQNFPVWACKHEYTPKSATKMDGQAQTVYPRKNWSSFMLFDCARCDVLTPTFVNAASGAVLHQFQWVANGHAPDTWVGALPLEWNWLVDEYLPNAQAKVLHYTLGGPWFEQTTNCDHADLWLAERAHLRGEAHQVG